MTVTSNKSIMAAVAMSYIHPCLSCFSSLRVSASHNIDLRDIYKGAPLNMKATKF